MAKISKKAKTKGKKEIDFRYNLSLYFSFLKKYKGLCIGLLLIILLIESASIVDKFLFKIIIDKGTEFSSQAVSLEALMGILLAVALIYIAAVIIKATLKFLYLHYINILEADMIVDLKRKFFNHLIHLDYSFHTTHRTGSLISRLVRIGGAVERMTDVIIFNFAPMILQLVVVFVSLVYFSWIPAVITFLTAVIFVSYSFFMQKIQENANVEANYTEDIEKANVSDIFTNIESIKYFGKENVMKKRFRNLSDLTKRAILRLWNYSRWFDSIQALILAAGTFFLIYFSLIDFLNGRSSLGTLVFFYTVFGSLFGQLFGFVHGIRSYYRAMADFEALFQYAKIENEVKDKQDAKELKIREGTVDFANISFNYGKRKIFENFNLKIAKDKKIALVGHSGSGKSTLIKLLYRFYDAGKGKILIDGKDIREFKQEALRNELAIVPQECVLFNDTIYNNIAFSKPGAKRQEVLRAIKFAQLDRIIKAFPNKEKTIVGERGIKLSGGEKQRVSIARAILANKKILVLDEATSSLDSQTEHEIQEDLKELMRGRTTIIIAHRLSTIMTADMIVVMEKGKIVQRGTHEKLINQPGLYKKLWNMQRGGYIR